MPPIPLALAMVVCDAIWADPGTGKKTILGTFSTIIGREFPLKMSQLSVYVALTDARGKVPLTLRLVDVDELRDPVISQDFEVDFIDPIMIAEGTFLFTETIFPEPGEYRLQLLSASELIIERRLLIMPIPGENR